MYFINILLKKTMIILMTSTLFLQVVSISSVMVYAERVEEPVKEAVEEQKPLELPTIKDFLNEEELSEPSFAFPQLHMQGIVEEVLKVTFFSDQEVSEARVFLPEEATLLKDQLPTGISVEEGAQPNEWIVQSKRAQKTFVLPLVVEQVGNYELSVEETTAHLEISEKEETSEEVPVEEIESSDEDEVGQEELKEENGRDEEQENEQPAEEVREPVSDAPQEQQTNEEETDEASQVVEPTVFDGETAEVATMAEFREAVGNPDIGIISVQANLTEATANVLTVDRPLFIQGNGYTLTFGINGFYFQLEEVTQASTIRLENATLTKVGITPLINATVESSKNWTVELEDITEVNANTMRLASLPEGSIHFTGGVSNFTRTTSAQTFIEAKEVLATNQAEVTISRGNATVFFSSATVSNPKFLVEQGATVTIVTAGGAANTIDLRGSYSSIEILSGAGLIINTGGNNTAPSNTANNVIALVGISPKIVIDDDSELYISSNRRKRAIHLVGDGAKMEVSNSSINMDLSASGGATGISLSGDSPVLSISNSKMGITRSSSTSSTSPTRSILLSGSDALLSVSNNSEVELTNIAALNGDEDVQIGNNNPRPYLKIENNSKLSLVTAGTTSTSTDTANNAIHLRGEQPKIIMSNNSEATVSVTSNARRGIYLNGSEPELILADSKLDITTFSGQSINLNGISPKMTMNEAELAIQSTTGQRMNLIGSNPVLNLKNSHLNMNATTGRGIYLQGETPQVLMDNSQLLMTDTDASQGMILQGEDALLSLNNQSNLKLTSAGIGTTENIQIGNNNARPELSVTGASKLSVTTTSSTAVATETTNNAIHLRGSDPKATILDGSELAISVTSNARRGIFLNGANAELTVNESQFDVTTISGQSLNLSGISPIMTLNKSRSKIVSTTGQRMNLIGSNPVLNFKNSQLDINATTGRGIYLQGEMPQVLIESSQLHMTDTGASQGIILQGIDSMLSLNNQSELMLTGASVSLNGNNSKLSVELGSVMEVSVGVSTAIEILGDAPKLSVSGNGTELKAISDADSRSTHTATIYLGLRGSGSSNAEIDFRDGANVQVIAGNNAPAMGIYSEGGTFSVVDKAEVNLKNGESSAATGGSAATLRFISSGSYKFLIDNSNLEISKDGGGAPGVRMFGGNNEIYIQNNGKFTVNNPGNGTPNNGGAGLGNQAVHYLGGSGKGNLFSVQGVGSEVNFFAANGPGIDMDTGSGTVTVEDLGYFSVTGRTSTAAGGIFNAGLLNVNFKNPLFMDFRNNRSGGGNIFNVNNNSTLQALNSDLSVWRNDSDLDGDPDMNFSTLDYSFTGINFSTLATTNRPEILNTTTFGNNGFTDYTRMSSNNGRWSIADELRVPTNADKKIHGRVSLPVGLDDSRPAWDDEAIVTVEVESPSGESTQEYTAKTVGDTNESPGISIYGEEPRGGLFEIDLEEPLEAGSKVRISKIELTSGELTDGFEHKILTDTVEVFPIIPPTPAQFSSSIIAQDSTMIRGMTDNLDAEVTATHNGEPLSTESVSVEADGRFTLDLSEVSLEMDDEIQVFLRDAEGSAVKAGVVNPPETNNTRGNINPTTEFTFHDVTFEPATTLIVGDLGPVSPVDPLDPEIEVDPENKPELPEDQGQLSIDFVSSFDFGSQAISVHDQTYYAQPQRLLNEDGTVNESEERPNYIQISDRRSENDRNGWTLAVTQKEQFKGVENQVLNGASLSLSNQQVITAQGGTAPGLQSVPCTLVPGNRRILLHAQGSEGTGTWIYRFGDAETAKESVALNVPKGANPEATNYSTTLTWELSAVPDN